MIFTGMLYIAPHDGRFRTDETLNASSLVMSSLLSYYDCLLFWVTRNDRSNTRWIHLDVSHSN